MTDAFTSFMDALRAEGGQEGAYTLIELLIAETLCLVCAIFIAKVNRWTARRASSTPGIPQTLVLTALVTTLVMVVIGSNIARAFALVGALAIVRFRNAVKETRDVAFIFFVLAIAMAFGTRHYKTGLAGAAFISGAMLLLSWFRFGGESEADRLLRVQLPIGAEPGELIEPLLRQHCQSYMLVQIERARQGSVNEATYSVRPKLGVTPVVLIDALGAVNGGLKVRLGTAQESEGL